LTTKALERAINRFVASNFNTYGQNKSLLGEWLCNLLFDMWAAILDSSTYNRSLLRVFPLGASGLCGAIVRTPPLPS
jgi:hypothetical protein